MSRSHELEQLFGTLMAAEGGPVISAHVLAETSGFSLDAEGQPHGHNDLVYALGLVAGGICAVKLNEDDDGSHELLKDMEGEYLVVAYIAAEDINNLILDLSELVSDSEGKQA